MQPPIGLVYTGRIIALEEIPNADFIACATVVCGKGGKWKGIIRKAEFELGKLCIVYLPDSLIPQSNDMKFMESSNWRVKMRRFKGAPSEVLITSCDFTAVIFNGVEVGWDVTEMFGVTKYHKPVPANLQGKAKGEFPGFIPKTDEPNYQNSEGQEGIEKLAGKPFFITEKADGSSTTAFKYKGQFGVCSRNWELERDQENGYWKVAIQHQLEERLPEGYAIQWETCGPKIQSNPMGFTDITGLAFSVYDIQNKKHLVFHEFINFCTQLKFPMVKFVKSGESFSTENLDTLGEGTYTNGRQREGVVVRSKANELGHKPISFKVINLNYEK